MGPGWARLAEQVATQLPVAQVDGIWVFPLLRHHQREFGTAIVSRVEGDRRRIYTARYVLAIKGKERGKFEAAVEEVGSGPVEALSELLQEVRKRTEDEEPPVPIDVAAWYPEAAALRAAEAELAVSDEAEGAQHVPAAEPEAEPEAETATEDPERGAPDEG